MLGKLLKYECKATAQILVPIYGLLLALSVILGFVLRGNSSYIGVQALIKIFSAAYILAGLGLIAVTIGFIVLQFYRNLLGNEGYLMFTLPVSTGQHIANKIISGTVWTILGIVVGCSSIFILGLVSGQVSSQMFFHDIHQRLAYLSNTTTVTILEIILLLIVCSSEMITKIYAAIAVGHQWSNHRKLGAALAYGGFSTVEFVVGVPIVTLIGNFSKKIITPPHSIPWDSVLFQILMINGIILLAIYWFVSWILLHKRLNLQ